MHSKELLNHSKESLNHKKELLNHKKKSLNHKIKMMNWCALFVILTVVIISVTASVNGMHQFGGVLDENEKTREFWNAVINEANSFSIYINDEAPEAYVSLEESRARTTKALQDLPYNYSEMTIEQYTQTNSIYNTYHSYRELQEQILSLNSSSAEYKNTISKYYTVEQYLESYAGKLETLTVEQGSMQYKRQKDLFYIIPTICVAAGAMVLITFLWLRSYIGRIVLRPVMMLSEEAKRISNNDFSGEELSSEGEDEMALLVNAFEEMKQSTKNYIATIEEKHQVEKQLVETRYQMLKNQINPHFLFNTLNLIASTAQIEDANTTEKMIVTLSRLFRYNLKSQTAVMPLEQELKVVSDYMYLQQMRFGQRVKYECFAAAETKQIMVPSFVLQPLVENAIIHGVSKLADGGTIYVKSWMRDGFVWISVADTGEGMDADQLNRLRERISQFSGAQQTAAIQEVAAGTAPIQTGNMSAGEESDQKENPAKPEQQGTGIGLMNIAERIQGMYENGGMRIYSKKGKCTVVQIYFKHQ